MLRRLTGVHAQLDKDAYGFESRLSSHLHNTLNGIQHIEFGWNDSEPQIIGSRVSLSGA